MSKSSISEVLVMKLQYSTINRVTSLKIHVWLQLRCRVKCNDENKLIDYSMAKSKMIVGLCMYHKLFPLCLLMLIGQYCYGLLYITQRWGLNSLLWQIFLAFFEFGPWRKLIENQNYSIYKKLYFKAILMVLSKFYCLSSV